ncbi:ATP-binding protein [Nonomuraea sp. NPDC049480]|uniref:ATP-binding protein n=1 Tax=Nonomuraea sp. NPDC049480 TaxID=3364353 RepID=UPI0037B88FF5
MSNGGGAPKPTIFRHEGHEAVPAYRSRSQAAGRSGQRDAMLQKTLAARDSFASCIPLPAMVSSVATARLHTRLLLQKWRLMAVMNDAELVVSELVTNAIKATNIIPQQARYPEIHDRMEVVCLCLYSLASELLIEVWDTRNARPTRYESTLDDEGGRGLFLVEHLSIQWGTRYPLTGGKTVWSRLAVGGSDEAF